VNDANELYKLNTDIYPRDEDNVVNYTRDKDNGVLQHSSNTFERFKAHFNPIYIIRLHQATTEIVNSVQLSSTRG
jgi:hypothetical protein